MSNGGPWGSGGGGDDREPPRRTPPRRPTEGAPIPEIEEIMKKGSEQLKVLMGGRTGRNGNGGGSGGGGMPSGPAMTGGTLALGALAVAAVWAYGSFYTVQQNERSIELMFGKYHATGNPGLNFAPWPVVTAEIVPFTDERTTEIGTGRARPVASAASFSSNASGDLSTDSGLMLTRDQNIVDIEFQVVWNVSDPAKFLFNLSDPEDTIRAVSESAMRDVIARSEMAPILNRDRGVIAADLRQAVQGTLDSYQAGINVVRVNFNRADPPREVIDSFRDVQAAQQERVKLQNDADAYANKVTAEARGAAAQIGQQAEAYRAQVVNDAQGQAARFTSVYEEYRKAPEVTQRRMFYEAMGQTLSGVNKVVIDGQAGAVPYLPLEAIRPSTNSGGSN